MERFLYKELLSWKSRVNRKPLLLQGARQVGKTYLLKEFATREYSRLAYFNFEQTPELGSIFESSLAPESLIESLSAFLGRRIDAASTLIFFDEIQAFPRAITSLKYFAEQAPEYHVVAAGSLLGVSVGKTTSFPVGKVNFMTLYPMSFFEYLAAMDEQLLIERLKKQPVSEQLPEIFHEKLTRLFKYYLYTGGMPEVVQSYIEEKDIANVRLIQKEILAAYQRDFSKHSTKDEAIRISRVWRSIPAQLARENKKFTYSLVQKGGRASRFETAIEWLQKAGLVYLAPNVKTPKLPLNGYADREKFKLYVLDTGLLGAMLDLPSRTIILGDELFSQYNGAFIENGVVGELVPGGDGDDIYYWTSNSQAEVDIVMAVNGKIFPMEIKSGLSRDTKSLRVFADKYRPQFLFRTSPRNFTKDGDFVNIPLYAVSLFRDIAAGII